VKQSRSNNLLTRRCEWGALVLILAVALALRLWGISFGLPHRYHIDEPYSVLGALRTASGDFSPRYPVNSPNLWEFILLLEYGAMFAVGIARQMYTSVGDFAASYRVDPTWFYLLARGTSALLGTATVVVVYQTARDIYRDRWAGLLAALFLAVAFLHGRDSHYAVADALVVFVTTAGVYLWVRYAQGGGLRALTLGSSLVGIAVGLKYRPIGLVVGLLAAVLLHPKALESTCACGRGFLKQLLAAGIALVAGYFVGFPGLFISVDLFRWHLNQAFAQAGSGFEGWLLGPSPSWLFYLRSLEWGVGLPLLILAVGGVILALRRRQPGELTVLGSAAGFYLGISVLTTYFSRYALSLHPLLVVFAAGCVSATAGWMQKRWPMAGRVASVVLVVGILIIPAARLMRHDYLLTQTDTRTLVLRWIEANVPEGASIAVDWPVHGPPLSVPGDHEPDSSRVYEVAFLGGKGLSDHSIWWYRDQGFDYLIASSFIYDIPLTDRQEGAERQAFYASLDEEFTLVQEVRPYRDGAEPPFVFDEMYGPLVSSWQRERPGPTIKIYRMQP
jgi:4-amino-4-deoxy-L-arabinose transferase-like glycosyltransferase